MRLVSGGSLAALLSCTAGCAIHHGNARQGRESVWGLGRVTWEVEPLTNGWMAVSSGTRLPGLVIGLGPDFCGIAFGYQVRERLQVATPEQAARTHAHLNGHELASTNTRPWRLGRIRLQTPPATKVAEVSGRAVAGLNLGLAQGWPSATAGWQTRQLVKVEAEDVFLELTVPDCAWPHFDFPLTQVAVSTATNVIATQGSP